MVLNVCLAHGTVCLGARRLSGQDRAGPAHKKVHAPRRSTGQDFHIVTRAGEAARIRLKITGAKWVSAQGCLREAKPSSPFNPLFSLWPQWRAQRFIINFLASKEPALPVVQVYTSEAGDQAGREGACACVKVSSPPVGTGLERCVYCCCRTP